MIDTKDMDTAQVLKIATEYAEKNGINTIVVATTSGDTGIKAGEFFSGKNIVAVTHSTGFKEEGEQELSAENRKIMEGKGVKVFTGPMIFHSWNDYYRKKKGTVTTTTIIADTLRMFGQGTKVAVEITAMAADAGLIKEDRVLAIAGTGHGADTVLLTTCTNSRRLMDMKIRDVVAKPGDW